MTTATFNFSVFSLAQLSSAGTGGSVDCGDKFTMPAGTSITMSVRDDDRTLSGDGSWWGNEHATDSWGQTANIISGGKEIGNCGQIYAESYFWVADQNGNWYVLIEIEQEGSSQKFYTFHSGYGVPEAGAHLTIHSQCDVTSNWIDYSCLTANAPTPAPGEICGRFTFDADGNDNEWNDQTCSWDKGLEGKTVQLLDEHGNVVAETTTDHAGNYKFVVPAGKYQVKFPQIDGTVFSKKDSGVAEHYDSDAGANGLTDFIHVASGQKVCDIDAGVKPEPKGEVCGRFFFDADHDGTEWNAKTCAWEKGVEGKLVQLLDKAGNVVAETTTAHDGSYSFHVAAGEYRVKFPSLDGFDFTHKDVGDYRKDSDADTNGFTDFFHVVAGQKLCDIDAGVKPEPQGHISGRLTFDADCNDNEWNDQTGKWDEGVDGQKVQLLDLHGNVVAESTTDHYGNYKFTVPAGKYQVKFPLLDGFEFSAKDSGVDDHFDSDADATGLTDVIHLSAGQSIHNVDAGLKQCAVCPDDALKLDFEGLAKGTIVSDQFPGVTISSFSKASVSIKVEAEHMEKHGFVTAYGSNASGCELVRLKDGSGKLATTFTGASGQYDVKIRVQDECDGQSTLKLLVNGVEVKAFKLAHDNNGGGSDNGYFNTVVIQDVHIPAGARVELVAHRDGHEFVRVDKLTFVGSVTENRAMIFDTDHITGGDFDLKNGDGKVLIISEDGDSSDPDDNAGGGVIDFDFDAPTHVYAIDVIDTEEGGKIEAFDADGVKIGEVAIPKIADGAVRTVVLNFEGVSELVVTLNGSGALDNLCYKPKDQDPMTAAIGDLVFFDANKNGLQDAGEAGVAGVTVELIDAAGDVIASTVTDANGAYRFEGLAAGDYRVRFANDADDPATAIDESALVFTTPDAGDDALDSDADATGLTGVISLAEGEENLTVDAGLVDPGTASISGRVFHDSDDDSLDVGEAEEGASGVRVVLQTAAGVFVAETTTAADGSYTFAGLDAGDYVVVFPTDVDGKVLVGQNVGGDDAIDSDADQTTGETGVISLAIGEAVTDVDAGVEDPGTASISGRYFIDTNDNDQDDGNGGEPPVEGVVVELLDAAGNGTGIVTITDANGNYSFTNLVAGVYGVRFTDPNGVLAGKTLITPNVGDDASDSDAIGDTTVATINGIVVLAGQETPDNDAGVEEANERPLAVDDMGKVCADTELTLNLLDNDIDPDGDVLSVISISDDDETVGVGGTITLTSGAKVTLNADGTVEFDGIDAYKDLLIGEQATAAFRYTVSDGDLTDVGDVDVTICGAKNTPETIGARVLDGATLDFTLSAFTRSNVIDAFTMTISNLSTPSDPSLTLDDFGGPVITEAYCIDSLQPISTRVLTSATVLVANETNAIAAGLSGAAAANIDLVNWILNQDFTSVDNGDGTNLTYTDLEVQEAIYLLLNGDTFFINNPSFPGVNDDDDGVREAGEFATVQNAQEIANRAIVEGEGFVASEGDILGLILEPTAPDSQDQPFIIGVRFDLFTEECVCA